MGRLKTVRIFGDGYLTADGNTIRDYVHVNDLAFGRVAAVQHLVGGGEWVGANLGTGRGFSVREIVDAVQRVTSLNVRYCSRGQDDPAVRVPNGSRAASLLDFSTSKPSCAPRMLDWHA